MKIRVARTLLIFFLLISPGLEEEVYRSDLYTEKISEDEETPFVDYLGMTYDIILGNPYGDPKLVVDLGFKRNILKRSEAKLNYLSFKSKEILCYYTHNPTIIRNIRDLSKEYEQYAFEPQYDVRPFNGSNYYKIINERLNRGDVVIIYKNICSKYFISFEKSYKEYIDPFFLNLLNEVSEFYQNIKSETSKCDIHMYKHHQNDEACAKNIKPWISFFNLYGTHLVTGGYFGAQIITNLYAEDYSFVGQSLGLGKINLNRNRLNPFYKNDANLYFGTITFNNKTVYLKERHLKMHGGVDFSDVKGLEKESYFKWKQSIIGEYAKPVRMIMIPFSDFINSESGKIAYFEALEFYSNLTYSEYNVSTFKIAITEKDLYNMRIQNWKQISAKNDNFNIVLKCSSTYEHMIIGFIITRVGTLSGSQMYLHLCPLSNECKSDIDMKGDNNYEFGWALCVNKRIHHEIRQLKKVTTGNSELACPSGMKIAFGFSFILKKDVTEHIIIENCKSNETKCATTKATQNAQSLIWINCIPADEEQFLQSLIVKSFSEKVELQKNTSYSLKCPEGTFIINGFAVDIALSDRGEGNICSTGASSCDLRVYVDKENAREIHVPIIYIVCYSL